MKSLSDSEIEILRRMIERFEREKIERASKAAAQATTQLRKI
ncbi:MAG: hypothetical protein AB7O79_10545 [Xanthobacteraceae bacterium]